MDLYREEILDHYKHPRNFGNIAYANAKSEQVNVSCGDRVSVELLVKKGNVVNAGFTGQGCAINQASASMLTEKIVGMSVARVKKMKLTDVEKLLGTSLTPSRVTCALLPLEAIQKALDSVLK